MSSLLAFILGFSFAALLHTISWNDFSNDSYSYRLIIALAIQLVAATTILVIACHVTSLRKLQRQLEARVGSLLLQLGTKRLIRKARLIKREQLVDGVVLHYYERPPLLVGGNAPNANNAPCLLLCHGITSEAKNLVALILELQKEGLPDHWRLIVPDTVGHGHDLQRVQALGVDHFPYPEAEHLGDSLKGLLDALKITQCHAYGASMGGCLVYFLQHKYPDLVQSSLLISPALEVVVDDQFLEDWKTGRKNHFCWESREDVQHFMQDLSCPQRVQPHPLPLFLLEALWQDRVARTQTSCGRGHYLHFRRFFQTLIDARGHDPDWLGCRTDIDPDARRLVLWPKEDYISNHARGQHFFAKSCSRHTIFRSIPDCGHLFHADGKTVLIHAARHMVEFLLAHE